MADSGVTVVPVLSQPSDGWDSESGYVHEKDENSKFQNSVLQKLDSQLNGLLSEVSKEEDFTGKTGQSTVIRLPGLGTKRVSLVGLGKGPSGFSTSAYRSLGESVASAAKASQANNVAITLASSEDLTTELKLSTTSAIATVMGKVEEQGDSWHGHVTAVTVALEFRRQQLAKKLMNLLDDISDKMLTRASHKFTANTIL